MGNQEAQHALNLFATKEAKEGRDSHELLAIKPL